MKQLDDCGERKLKNIVENRNNELNDAKIYTPQRWEELQRRLFSVGSDYESIMMGSDYGQLHIKQHKAYTRNFL